MVKKIGVILGTVRNESLGIRIFEHLKKLTEDNREVEYSWINLRDYPLPFYNHPEVPLGGPISSLNTVEKEWLEVLEQQDGYLILTPEYDHAIPGVLKNALDFIGFETKRKPVQIIAYTKSSDGGIVAAQSLVQILQIFQMIVLPEPVLLWEAENNFDSKGRLNKDVKNSDHFNKRLKESLREIEFYTKVLTDNPFIKD